MSRSARLDLDERVDKAEELLCVGLSPGHVERQLAKDYAVSIRQSRRYIQKVYQRWQNQTIADAPHRREKVIRMTERFFAKSMGAKDLKCAVQALHILAKMSGAFTQHDPARAARIAALGQPPTDPTQALVWAQRAMLDGLYEVLTNPALDPERRLRWICEFGSKLGMTHSKTLVEARLDAIEEHAGLADAKSRTKR